MATKRTNPAYADPAYKAARRRLLKPGAVCYWCGGVADTVDHLVELDRGGDHGRENTVAACISCNSRRGAQYGNRKRSATRKARSEASGEAPARRPVRDTGTPVKKAQKSAQRAETARKAPAPRKASLGGSDGHPDLPTLSLSETKRTRPARSATEPDRSGSALILPRLETIVDRTRTYGPLITGWAERALLLRPLAWQRYYLDGLLAHDHAGRIYARSGLCHVARQNGKSILARMLIGAWLVEMPRIRGESQMVLSCAHELDLAVSVFSELAPVLEEHYGAKVRRSYGRNEVTMPDGSRWIVRAATASAGHGRSPDLVIVDETWSVGAAVVEQGLLPAQRARRDPLLVMLSTAGTEKSELMLRWRERAIRAIDAGERNGRLYCAEWSPRPDCDPESVEAWKLANPAIGELITEETLAEEAQRPNRSAFLRGSLNLWVQSDEAWLRPTVWDRARWDDDRLPPATVWAIDSSLDGSRFVAVSASPVDTPAGPGVVLEVQVDVDTSAELWRAVEEIPAGVVLAVTPSLEIHVPHRLRSRTETVGYGELLRWTSVVRSLIDEGRVFHTGSTALADHMGRAVAVQTQTGLALSSQRSAGPIELARCAVWATALATRSRAQRRPTVVVAQRRPGT
jgi:hypothetical protein